MHSGGRDEILGTAYSDHDLVVFLEDADVADPVLDDPQWVEWRGGPAHEFGAARRPPAAAGQGQPARLRWAIPRAAAGSSGSTRWVGGSATRGNTVVGRASPRCPDVRGASVPLHTGRWGMGDRWGL